MAGSPTHAVDIHTAARNSLFVSTVAGVIVAVLAFTLSMAFRRRWRFGLDSAAFYVIMLALMTPGFLLAVGTQLFWSYLGLHPSIWKTAVGANVVWGIPFGFLVMLAVWNRYDARVEEAARDLGADQRRTFREVTLPLIWTGIFGCFLFGFTLTWNDYDRSVLFQTRATDSLPLEIGGITFTSSVRPDLYALGTATTVLTLLVIGFLLLVASVRRPRRGRARASGRGGVRRHPGHRRRGGSSGARHREVVVQTIRRRRLDGLRSRSPAGWPSTRAAEAETPPANRATAVKLTAGPAYVCVET